MLFLIEIGKNIVAIRKKLKVSQEELALRADMSTSYLRNIEHGIANPTFDVVLRIAKALGVDWRVIFLLNLPDSEIAAIMHMVKILSEQQK